MYEESEPEKTESIFDGKEVLLKIITLMSSGQKVDPEGKLELIEQISAATNQQTPVIAADRQSNEHVFLQIQQTLFDRYGILYERKRGEFADGLHKKYIDQQEVLERNLFFRLFLASNGNLQKAGEKKLFLKFQNPEEVIKDENQLDNFYFGYLAYSSFMKLERKRNYEFQQRHLEVFGKVYAMTKKYRPSRVGDFETVLQQQLKNFEKDWKDFMKAIEAAGQKYIRKVTDKKTGEERIVFNRHRWLKSKSFEEDISKYFALSKSPAIITSVPTAPLATVISPGEKTGIISTGPVIPPPKAPKGSPNSPSTAIKSADIKRSWFSRIFSRNS